VYRPEIHENNVATKLMFPNDARLRNFTYTSNITLDLNIRYIIRSGASLENEEIKDVKLSKIQFGKVPIMLKSCICILNQYNHVHPEKIEECKWIQAGISLLMVQKRLA
jgi:DNA-directed RNA polymerase II subunit RPB2